MKDQIQLINHSSVLINNDDIKILTDPWYSGSAFNDGWSLLYENKPEEIKKILYDLNYIFLSHEHPDHFSVKFFNDYGELIKNKKIKIIFQDTIDKRVENFLRAKGLELLILKDKEKYKFDDKPNFTIIKQGHIDSSFLYETTDAYHLNINDCNFIEKELYEINSLIKNKEKKVILYIQFSYASFRGTDEWLKKAAKYKLENIVKLAKIFNSSLVIPFASLFYFSHSENQNLKKFANNCKTVSNFLISNNINHCILNPNIPLINVSDLIESSNFKNEKNIISIEFWDKKINDSNIVFYEKEPVPILPENIEKFLYRLKKFNNFFLLFLIRIFSFKKIFGDVFVKINKTDEIFLVNFFKVEKIINTKLKPDISMSSEAFNLLLSQPYGLESLFVSGRLKSEKLDGMSKITSALGILTINLANYGINFKHIFNKLIFNKIIGLIYRAITQKT